MPLANQNQPQTANGNHGDQADKNTSNPVRISELPPVTVLPTKRDWVDWGFWVFNGLLVLVGAFQALFLWGTLRVINRQAKATAKEVVLLNRAYLTIDNWMEQENEQGIKFRIYNPSKTAARVEEINYTIQDKIFTEQYGLMLTPGESQWIGIPNEEIPEARVEDHRMISVAFIIRGRITYRDIFKKIRHRTFTRMCTRDLMRINFSIPNDVGANDEKEWNEEES